MVADTGVLAILPAYQRVGNVTLRETALTDQMRSIVQATATPILARMVETVQLISEVIYVNVQLVLVDPTAR